MKEVLFEAPLAVKDYQVLARKYRPQTFAEVLGQEAIVTTLKNGIKYNRLAHAYLFCGSRGTGKTTLARILAKALNCSHRNEECEPCGKCNSCREIAAGSSLEVLEIDGASHRGIDDIRQINDTVGYASAGAKYSLYIIDEVHMLTKEAFNALLKTLEEPPARVKFFFATTEPHKVPATILSRCQRFNLNRIPLPKIIDKLSVIIKEQNIEIEDEALRLIAKRADGGFRDAESLLDQIIAFHEGAISAASVADVLGTVPSELFFQLDEAGKKGHLAMAFEVGYRIFTEGKDISHFIELWLEHFRTLLLLKITGEGASFLEIAAQDLPKYAASAKLYSQEQCLTIIDLLIESQSKIRFMPSPRMALEALLLKVLKIHSRLPIDFLVKRLSELEEAVAKAHSMPVSASAKEGGEKKDNLPETVEESKALTKAPEKASEEIKALLAPTETRPQAALLNSITEDPTPSAADLGHSVPKPASAVAHQQPTAEQQKEAKKRQSRYDTILQFAAIELEGSLQKKSIRGF